MSSFKRRVQSNQAIPVKGAIPSPTAPSLLQISTGVPSIDDLLGGGLPLGHIMTILAPDIHSAWGELIARYYIAQGLSTNQHIFVADQQPQHLVSGCMWHPGSKATPAAEDDIQENKETNPEEKVKIAWRYEQMGQFKTTVDERSNVIDDYCHTFDLVTTVPHTVISKAEEGGSLLYYEPAQSDGHNSYDELLYKLTDLLQQTSEIKFPLRICIHNLGDFYWGQAQSSDILRFLIRLRSLVRNTRASVMITLPVHLSSPSFGNHWIPRVAQLADACFTMQGITNDPVLGPTFPSYSGLLTVHSSPSPHTLLDASRRFSQLRGLNVTSKLIGTGGGENNLAFKCMRKRLVVETLHLDVEGGVGERRTTPSTIATSDPPPVYAQAEANTVKLAKIEIDTISGTPPDQPPTEKPKKAKKKVVFQASESDLYDF
ncbi:PAXNEB-domain-containing protein [Serendipita vermifera]|nr:PAXNEB-domain-containing protein [Serendipita vermifera]